MGDDLAVSFAPGLRPLLVACGLGPSHARVRLRPDAVDVSMGWAFRMSAPRASVRSAALDDRPVRGWGVHGRRGRWLVNGSSNGVVKLELDPPVRARVLGLPTTVRELRVSLEEPEALVAALPG